MSLMHFGLWDAPVVGFFSGSEDQCVSDAFEGTSEIRERLSASLDACSVCLRDAVPEVGCSYRRPPAFFAEDVLVTSGVLWNFNMCLNMGLILVNYN